MDGHSFGVVRHPQAREMPEVPLPGAALAEELDKRMMLQLRDDRKVIGTLRSFDQFANLLLEDAIERIYVGNQYADKPLGLQVVRGENVVLLGQIDPDKEVPPGMTQVSEAEIMAAQKADKDFNKMAKTMRARMDFLDME